MNEQSKLNFYYKPEDTEGIPPREHVIGLIPNIVQLDNEEKVILTPLIERTEFEGEQRITSIFKHSQGGIIKDPEMIRKVKLYNALQDELMGTLVKYGIINSQ